MPSFPCPGCGRNLQVKDGLAGCKGKCPHCGKALTVPAAARRPSLAEDRTIPPPSAADNSRLESDGSDAARELTACLAPPLGPGEIGRLGPYRVLKILGAGGMGVVYLAEDPQLERPAALKAMLPSLGAGGAARQRFLQEARAAAAVKHDHVVTIYQVGEDRGIPYLAMEFLHGESLDDRLRKKTPIPIPEVLRIGRETAEGLQAAHERGLIHRDIKPANIWLESAPGRRHSRVKILDFGLARAIDGKAQLTQQGAILGTPAYMAPEQARGETVDHRCDLFSLGCVLYRLGAGQPAFARADMISTLMAVASEDPRPPREINPAVPEPLANLVMQLLDKTPAQRPESAEVVADLLQQMERQIEAPGAHTVHQERPMKAPDPARTKSGKSRLMIGALCLAGVLVAASIAAFFLLPGTKPGGPSSNAPAKPVPPAQPEFVSLFNGKDLTGWTVAQGATVDWKIENGAIVCKTSQHGWLKSDKQYGDFVLRLKWRLGAKGNSGVYLRVPDKPGAPEKIGASEIQILDDPSLPKLSEKQLTGAIFDVAGPAVSVFKGVEQWHSFEITCKGSRITVVVDNEAVVDANAAYAKLAKRPRKGFLGLQSWEGRVEFRDIAVRELTDKPAARTPPTLPPRWTAAKACPTKTVFAVAVAPDGTALASAGLDRGLRFWNPRDGAFLPPALAGHEFHRIAFAGDSRRFATWEGQILTVSVWDAKTRTRWTLPNEKLLKSSSFALSGNGRFLAVSDKDNTVRLWDVEQKRETVLTGAPGKISDLVTSSDGRFVAAAVKLPVHPIPMFVGLWEVARPNTPFQGRANGRPHSLRFSPNGRTLAALVGAAVRRWDVPTLTPQGSVRVDMPSRGMATLGPDARTVVSGSDDPGKLAVWDTMTAERLATLVGTEDKVYSLDVTQDGRTIVASCADGAIRLWQLPAGEAPQKAE